MGNEKYNFNRQTDRQTARLSLSFLATIKVY